MVSLVWVILQFPSPFLQNLLGQETTIIATMVPSKIVRLLTLSFLWRLVHGITEDHECNACAFWKHDLPDCKVYGQLHTGGIVAFNRADDKCLLYYNIRVQTVDAERIETIFPTPDGAGGDVEGFIQLLQDDVNATRGAVYDFRRSDMKDFFVRESEEVQARVVLKDTIAVGATQYDCTVHNGRDCWTALRQFFAQTPEGEKEMHAAGKFFWLQVQLDGEQEQKSARIAICADNEPPSVCGALKDQIVEIWAGNPEMDCSLFGLGKGGFHSSQINCFPPSEIPGPSSSEKTSFTATTLFFIGFTATSFFTFFF